MADRDSFKQNQTRDVFPEDKQTSYAEAVEMAGGYGPGFLAPVADDSYKASQKLNDYRQKLNKKKAMQDKAKIQENTEKNKQWQDEYWFTPENRRDTYEFYKSLKETPYRAIQAESFYDSLRPEYQMYLNDPDAYEARERAREAAQRAWLGIHGATK